MLDGGPSRIPQPIDRRGAYRREPVQRQPSEPSPEVAEEEPISPVVKPARGKKTRKSPRFSLMWLGLVVIAVVGLVVAVVFFGRGQTVVKAEIDNSKYQAVFFANGQVYFGKLSILDDKYFLLDDVFYIQSNITTGQDPDQPDEESIDEGSQKLIKRGSEVHGPADPMVISSEQMMFFENLKPEGKVPQLIQSYKSGAK